MKAFELRCNEFNFQDDMETIISHLSLKGHINVGERTLEKLYEEFSEERWCRWKVLDEETLNDFTEWLLDRNV